MNPRDSDTEKIILNHWQDINFPGSFRGVKTFQTLLKTELNINIPEKKLYKILKKNPLFLVHQIKRNFVKRRPYLTFSYGEYTPAIKSITVTINLCHHI